MKVVALGAWTIVAVLMPAGRDLRVSPAEAARPAQAAHTCQNIQLLIRVQTSQGAAGHIGVIYRVHNLSSRACTLFGYPGVQLLDRHFVSLPTTEHRGPGGLVGAIPKRLVHVGPHGNAYFALGYSDVPVNNRPCATAYYLMIFAPNDFLPVVTYAARGGGIIACSGAIDVSPVTAQPRLR
jgi:hypothetical protein